MPGTTAFPAGLDTFPLIEPNTPENAAGKEHDVQHNNVGASIVALQTKVGVDGSTDPTSLDARVAALEAGTAPAFAAVAIQFLADAASTVDADPGAGKLRWNDAVAADATMLLLDDTSNDGVALTGLWAALDAGGFTYLQHATDQDTWQIWEVSAVTDATGYAKLTTTLLAKSSADFADGDAMLVTIEQGRTATVGDVVGPASAADGAITVFDGGSGKQLRDSGTQVSELAKLAAANSWPAKQSFKDIAIDDAVENARDMQWATAGVLRWMLRCTGAAEAGSNSGSDFQLLARNDAGDALGTVFSVVRATQVLTFNQTPIVPTAPAGETSTKAASTAFVRTPSVQSIVSAATVTPSFSDDMVKITGQAEGLTLANPTGTAINGHGLVIRIKDNGTARSIAYGAQYRAVGVSLPASTVVSKTLYLGLIYNADDTKWDVVAVAQEA